MPLSLLLGLVGDPRPLERFCGLTLPSLSCNLQARRVQAHWGLAIAPGFYLWNQAAGCRLQWVTNLGGVTGSLAQGDLTWPKGFLSPMV